MLCLYHSVNKYSVKKYLYTTFQIFEIAEARTSDVNHDVSRDVNQEKICDSQILIDGDTILVFTMRKSELLML